MAKRVPPQEAILHLNSLESGRKTVARFVRWYHKGEISENHFRTVIYGMSCLLSYFKAELALDIETRIEAIEEVLEEDSKYRPYKSFMKS